MARTKKEIDKEMMYKKIMPSAVKTSVPDEDDEDENDDAPAKAPRSAKAAPQSERFAGAQLDKLAASVRKKVAALSEEPLREPLAPPGGGQRPWAGQAEHPEDTDSSPSNPSFPEQRSGLQRQPASPTGSTKENTLPSAGGESQPAPHAERFEDPVPLSVDSLDLEPQDDEPLSEKKLVNQMELLVEDRLATVAEKFHCCDCEKCHKDIVAVALNKLKPHYVVLDDLAPAPLLDRQTTAEVTTAIIQAVLIVKAHPRH